MQYFFSFVNHSVGRKPFPRGLRCLLLLQLLLLLLIISPSSLDLLLSQPIGGGTGAERGDENTARVLRAGIATVAAAAAATEEEEDSSLSILLDINPPDPDTQPSLPPLGDQEGMRVEEELADTEDKEETSSLSILDRSPAHYAAQLNKSDIIRILCYGGDLNKLDDYGEAPVHVAAFNNYPGVICALHACGADLNKRNTDGETPAHVAARTNHSSVLQVLYECGADLNSLDSADHTPAHVAAMHNYPDIIQTLHKYGANLSKPDRLGWTPGKVAAVHGHFSVTMALLECGADFKERINAGRTRADEATCVPSYLRFVVVHGETTRTLHDSTIALDSLVSVGVILFFVLRLTYRLSL